MSGIVVCEADSSHAVDACWILRRSILEVCGPDYGNDPAVMEEWLSNKTSQNVANWIDDSANYAVIAKRNDAVVGFALLRGDEIILNYVVPECLGRGVGFMMLKAMERHAAIQELRELRCMSTVTALSFYERYGFVRAGDPVPVGDIVGEFPLRKPVDGSDQ